MSIESRLFSIVLVITLLNCSISPTSIADEKTLRFGIQLLPSSYGNPYVGVSLPGNLPLQAIFDSLTRVGDDGSPEPWLATSWHPENKYTWVLKLRKNVQFSNGEPFDAYTVVDTVNYLLSEQGRRETIGTHLTRVAVTGAQARGSHVVEIVTSRPNAILPIHLDYLRIPAPNHWRDMGRDKFALDPVGTGPFEVERWKEGHISLKANRKSWRAPFLARVEIIQVADQAARVQALLSGSLDVAFNVGPEDRAAVENAGGRLIVYRNPGVYYIQYLSVKDSPLQSLKVRQALNYAVNKELIVKVLFDGGTVPVSQIAHPQAFGYNTNLTPYPYDPAKAESLLDEAGYRDGFRFSIYMVGGGANDLQAHQQVAADLARIGVTMDIQRTTLAKYLEYMYQTSWPDPIVGFSMFTSGFDPMHGYRTRSCRWTPMYYCDPDIMPLIDMAEAAFDLETRRKLVGKVLAFERNNPSGLYLWQAPSFDAISSGVTGYKATGDFVRFHEIALGD